MACMDVSASVAIATERYDCPLCNFASPTRNQWISHLRSVHHNDDNFSVVCGIRDCTATYTKCASIVSHVYRKHREALSVSGDARSFTTTSLVPDAQLSSYYDPSDLQIDQSVSRSVDMEHTISQILGTDTLLQKEKAALYILNLKEVHGLSETAVQHVIGETKLVLSHSILRIKAGVSEHLSRHGIEVPDSLQQMFLSVKDPFEGLHTIYLQEKFYRENLNCSVSGRFNFRIMNTMCVIVVTVS